MNISISQLSTPVLGVLMDFSEKDGNCSKFKLLIEKVGIKFNLDEVFSLDQLQSLNAQASIGEGDITGIVRLLKDNVFMFLSFFGILMRDFLLAVFAQVSLSTVHACVVLSIILLAAEKVWIVDVLLRSLRQEVDVEEELLFLVLGEAPVQNLKVSEDDVLSHNELIVGSQVTKVTVSGSAVVGGVIASQDATADW